MAIPTEIRQGDTLVWETEEGVTPLGDPIRSSDGWALTTYVRFQVATGATQATGTVHGDGWRSTISAGLTGLFPAGQRGSWQEVASRGEESFTIGTGAFTVVAGLSAAGAVDDRSQARRDLDACQEAIRQVMSNGGVQEFSFRSRSRKYYDLSELLALEAQLKADLVREEAAQSVANGQGNPYNLFVRFG